MPERLAATDPTRQIAEAVGSGPFRFLPGERVVYLHVAGHYREKKNRLIDTHGAAVIEPVWELLARVYRRFGVKPTLLERDFNIPPLDELLLEIRHIDALQAAEDLFLPLFFGFYLGECRVVLERGP